VGIKGLVESLRERYSKKVRPIKIKKKAREPRSCSAIARAGYAARRIRRVMGKSSEVGPGGWLTEP